MFAGLGHPWRTGHRDVALAALGIAYVLCQVDSSCRERVEDSGSWVHMFEPGRIAR